MFRLLLTPTCSTCKQRTIIPEFGYEDEEDFIPDVLPSMTIIEDEEGNQVTICRDCLNKSLAEYYSDIQGDD